MAVLTGQALPAVLTYTGDEVIITGSVGDIFESQAFVGPNRGDKQDRQRIIADVAEFSSGFETARTQLASLRSPSGSELPHSTALASGVTIPSLTPTGTPLPETVAAGGVTEDRIQVAAIDPTIGSSALDAIAGVDQSVPLPAVASEQLAYGRANAPVTDLSLQESKYSDKEVWCLATAIYFEARGEVYRGQVAVAQVVMNRVAHKLYPDTICGVVFQNQQKRNACQFSFACDGRPETITEPEAWAQAQEIAVGVAAGALYLPEVGNATHYHATYVYPYWAPKLKKMATIGLHVFYRFKNGWTAG